MLYELLQFMWEKSEMDGEVVLDPSCLPGLDEEAVGGVGDEHGVDLDLFEPVSHRGLAYAPNADRSNTCT